MAEPRRKHQIVFRKRNDPSERGPLPGRPWVDYRDKPELVGGVKSAARTVWPSAVGFHVEVRGRWQDCQGLLMVRFASSVVEAEFMPQPRHEREAEDQTPVLPGATAPGAGDGGPRW